MALHDNNTYVRYLAAMLLARIGSDAGDAVPSLIEALKRPADLKNLNVETRREIAASLYKIVHELSNVGREPSEVSSALKAISEDENEDRIVRRAAAFALQQIQRHEAPPR